MDAILKTVVYDTSVPVIPASFRDPNTLPTPSPTEAPSPEEKPSVTTTLTDRARSAGSFVGHGLRATVGLVVLGVFKIVESSLGLDDNNSTSTGTKDRAFNQWLDDRDQWRAADRKAN
ncbi:hypothetical protein RISK_004973 [Rhodopirellula islandica]|uniref:Uncharacterized protein n=1 Tax=Rhodopirellula islandica TaxID=595434 RepID=A0A0J1B901_RHOIS|nr:hypothetical protein RISK_004973 [Rhodopirellula islandica]